MKDTAKQIKELKEQIIKYKTALKEIIQIYDDDCNSALWIDAVTRKMYNTACEQIKGDQHD